MARIAGIDLPTEKRIVVALTYIYGIGPTTAKKLLASAGVEPRPGASRREREQLLGLVGREGG